MFSLLMLFYVVTIYHSIVMRGLRYSSHLPNCLLSHRIPLRRHSFPAPRLVAPTEYPRELLPYPDQFSYPRGAISYCFVMTVLLSTNKMESVSKLLISSVAFDVTFDLPSVR